jgi:hypothetical protein
MGSWAHVRRGGEGLMTDVHEGDIGACLRPSTAAEEAARQARGCIFSCKKKE